MNRRHFGGRPLHQQDVLITPQRVDVVFPALNQKDITRLQTNISDPRPDHLGAPLNTKDNAMVLVPETDLHEGQTDQTRGRRDHGFGKNLVANLPALRSILGLKALPVGAEFGMKLFRLTFQRFGQCRTGGGNNNNVAFFERERIIKRRKKGFMLLNDDADGHILEFRENPPRGCMP